MTQSEVIVDQVVLRDGFVPLIDISSARNGDQRQRQAVAEAIGRCCETSGFLLLAGHGVPDDVIEDVNRALREFFSLPQAGKERVGADPADPLARGYSSAGNLAATNDGADTATEHQTPDQVEKFVYFPLGSPEGFDGPGWPEVPGFRAAYERYYDEMAALATELSRLFALALGLREDWFDGFIDRHNSNLMANHYPADDQPEGHIRLSQHSDWGNLTILLQDETQSGLQVRGDQGEWLDVPVVPGSFVINIGDLLARWTNDRWVSTVHRVVSTGAPTAERFSLPFFHQPNFDAVIECIPTCASADDPPRYDPVVSGPYLLNKFKIAYDLSAD
ncbi:MULTISPECIES: isopenicillin N synthase family dioxygenase [Mycolicibacterium]|uniref:Isopenicillin N synthase family oxygenase n=1 Tax=Mycolicibacterium farcinogenes TaxID=1802 RepID=A0ACD1FLR1_MYCFR|nr:MULTISPECIES: 2OG-Fe(II) oxygenase family protein [Mycolicibacterium]MCW1824637.1 isopenicillin N synthase family oxygenase [Mycolicibacterium senegalense]QZH60446.1 isopenicillin N synthase family oxygenase [Mycolicibacterium farcinogenes]QZH67852.1 isopenicillin N synthase family oxygenase [Mycolicibacterium farcinogenes]